MEAKKSYWQWDLAFIVSLFCTTLSSLLHTCVGKAYNGHLNDPVILKKKAVRIIGGVPSRTNMAKFYIDMNILNGNYIYNYNIGSFVYRYVNNRPPDVFNKFFTNISDIHEHNTRNVTQRQIYITFYGTTRGQKTAATVVSIFGIALSKIQFCVIGSFKNDCANY